jgi:hypothetical protein
VEGLDQFKKNNEKNLADLESNFCELKYQNIDNFAQHVIIRSEELAHQFGLSSGDIGAIYLLKQTTKFQNESSFLHNGLEYNLTKIEPDPNLETVGAFLLKEKNHYSSLSNYLVKRVIVNHN